MSTSMLNLSPRSNAYQMAPTPRANPVAHHLRASKIQASTTPALQFGKNTVPPHFFEIVCAFLLAGTGLSTYMATKNYERPLPFKTQVSIKEKDSKIRKLEKALEKLKTEQSLGSPAKNK